ncbi:hypothetical protein Htur_3796 (plasmid) [Haloterrigena turkmenica DSM 5511]|uniref:Uncharacterized protein n=1 Tax=Haloterrigena turkmenica (strain ATCC 51198 / DSM 5511 / JCM 9101 / NCIMB 13204 / VKM B-1734 / 4k) TaxID=543526 RepID=D2RZW1_HALTV|nr:hypothetical protein [Haloterrigena turkmenica]ADB62658.1 hypothetical protein Htur_3796 [Haloterrigena turkmenica DSM 5511]
MPLKPEPTANRIDPQTIPPETTVCHFDELDDGAKDCLLTLLDERDSDTPEFIDIEGLTACDVVKYVDYYDLDLPEIRVAD